MSDTQKAGHLAALVTILIWGTTFISTKLLLERLSPMEILFSRFLLGYAALWLVRPRRLRLERRRSELLFAAAGASGVALYYLLENLALTQTLASNVGVICSVAPFFTALFSAAFFGTKRPGPQFFLGFVLAMTGVALISFRGGAAGFQGVGDLLALLAALLWSVYSILTKKLAALDLGPILTTRRTFFYGLLFMVPALFLLPFRPQPALLLQPSVLPHLLFLGLGASALCFVTWNLAVGRLGSVKTSVYIYLVPVVTTAASALVLGERLTPAALCGALLTLAGLFLSQERPPRPAEAR